MRAFEIVIGHIRSDMLAGRLQPGDRLPNERDLCVQLGVSRNMLREALRVLEALGIVEVRLGTTGGVFIREPTGSLVGLGLETLLSFRSASAADLANFRSGFEGENAFWAATNADDQDLGLIASCCARLREATASGDDGWHEVVDLDARFHESVAQATHNELRLAVERGINLSLRHIVVATRELVSPELKQWIGEDAERILQAIEARRPALARTRMVRHVENFSPLEIAAEEKETAADAADGARPAGLDRASNSKG